MFRDMSDNWMMAGSFGLSHLLVFAAFAVLVLYPLGLVLKRLGYSPLWAALAFVPIVNLVALWVIALAKDDEEAEA
jgi:hypothetical protein